MGSNYFCRWCCRTPCQLSSSQPTLPLLQREQILKSSTSHACWPLSSPWQAWAKGSGNSNYRWLCFLCTGFFFVCGGVLSSLCWMQWQSSTVPHGNESSCWSAWLPHSYSKTPFQISVTFEPQSWSSSSKFVSPPKQQEETNNPTSTQSTRQIYRWDLKTLLSSSGANIQMGFRNITVFIWSRYTDGI